MSKINNKSEVIKNITLKNKQNDLKKLNFISGLKRTEGNINKIENLQSRKLDIGIARLQTKKFEIKPSFGSSISHDNIELSSSKNIDETKNLKKATLNFD